MRIGIGMGINTGMNTGALDGILVVAIEQAVAAPTCTVRLADAGARVIKIEREVGETARNYDEVVDGNSANFVWLNRGKESAVLDLKSQSDLAVLRRMLKKADVLVQNLSPGALGRMGFTSEVLATDYPQLIVISITGYGQDTPYADMRAYDLLVQAESGVCAVTGTPDSPVRIGVSVADIACGMNAHAAVLEALLARRQTGKGQQIEIAMFDCMADWMSVPLLFYDYQNITVPRYGLAHPSIYPYGAFACADGVIFLAIQTNAEFARLCERVLGRPDLATHKDFHDNPSRDANRGKLDAELMPIFAGMAKAAVIKAFKAADIAYAEYAEVADLSRHPALRRLQVDMPGGKRAAIPLPAGRPRDFTAKPIPALGQHTQAIMDEFGEG